MFKKIQFLLLAFFISTLSLADVKLGLKAYDEGNYETAIYYFDKELEKADTDTLKKMFNAFLALANFYAAEPIDSDYKKTFKHAKAVIDIDYDARIHKILGHLYRLGRGTGIDYQKAVENYELSIKHKDDDGSVYQLGFMYRNGIGVEVDYEKSRKYFERGHALDNESSQFELGLIYEFGKGVEKDIDKALEFYKLSAKKDDVDAKYRIKLLNGEIPDNLVNRTFQEGLDYMYGFTKPMDWDKAIEIFRENEKRNHAQSIYNIAVLKSIGSNVKGRDEVFELVKKAAELGLTKAQSDTAYYYRYGLGTEVNLEQSVFWEKKAAEQGNIESITEVAKKYYDGDGVAKNYETAIEWFEKAKAFSDPESIFRLAQMYENGEGVDKDMDKALELYTEAAELNYEEAYKEISDIYLKGLRGIEKNDEKSFYWSKAGADKGYADSQNKLAIHYYKGIHVPIDMEKAFEFYKKSAEQGFSKAYVNLGLFYEQGIAVKKDYKEAFKWYMKAAEVGNKNGMFKVGEFYDYAYYVGEDNEKALEWFEKAAEKGHKDAQYGLGSLYFNGNDGFDKNYKLAAEWYRKAADNEDEEKESRSVKLKTSSYGSGFFVTPNHIITNNHVTDSCDAIEVKNKGYKSVVELVDSDKNTDLSILVTGNPHDSFLNLRNGKAVRTGEQAIALGYPLASRLGSQLKVTIGNVAALTGYQNNIAELQLTAPVQPGNSGGPLLDDNGNVIGVIVSRLERTGGLKKGRIAQNVNFAIKSNMAKIFMDLNMIDYTVKKPSDKVKVNQIVENARDSVVQIICKEEE